MTKKMWSIVVISIVLVLAIAGCIRPATTPPAATPTTSGALPFPVPATDNTLRILQTQTAIAKGLQPAGTVIVLPTATAQGAAQPATQPAPATQAPPPPTATQPAVAQGSFQPTPGLPSTYKLQKGEFPYCIARRFNLNPAEVLSINGMTVNSRPAIGTVLKIPTTGNHWTADGRSLKKHPVSYTVVSGDTIYTISCAFGDVDPNGIIAVNTLKSPYSLTAGQTLAIP